MSKIFQMYAHFPVATAPDVDTSAEVLALTPWVAIGLVSASFKKSKESEDVTDTLSGGKKESRPTYEVIGIEAKGIMKRAANGDPPAWLSSLQTAQNNSATVCLLLLDDKNNVSKARGHYLLSQILEFSEEYAVDKSVQFSMTADLDGTVTGVNKYVAVTVP